ncbi:MAG: hypothetical protein ACE5HI_06190, partial [bacterium]
THLDGDIYVWLEGFKIGTRTDEDGYFHIDIPKELGESSYAGLNGIFKLYFYVANYNIQTVDVVVRNGMFVYGEGGVGRDGSLREVVTMGKILNIFTLVVPKWVHGDFDGPINVQVTLQATHDSVTVIYPKSIGGLLGAILLRHKVTYEIFVDIPDLNAKTRALDIIGTDPKSRRMIFQLNGTNYRDLFLPVGDYEVIPYFLIEHDDLPQELLQTLGDNVEMIGKNFLKIPHRREGGRFRVID